MAEKRVRTSARDEQLGHTTPPARGARSYGVVARKTRSYDTAARNTDSYDLEGRKVRSYETPSPLRSQRGKRLSRNGTHAAWLKRCPARMKIYIRLWAHVGREARSYEFPFRATCSHQCTSRPLFAPAARLHPTRGASRPPPPARAACVPPLYVSRRLGMAQVLCAMDARKQQRARLARGKGGTGTTFGAREQADTEVAGT